MKRILAASLIAAAFAAPAYAGTFADVVTQLTQPLTVKPQTGGIPHTGDETDLSWQYVAPTAQPLFNTARISTDIPVRQGDTNDTSWLYQPNAKPQFEGSVANASSYVEFADENDLRWLYQAPSAGRLADAQRQHAHVGFDTSVNPIAKIREHFSKTQTSGQ
jgi:hypothetical protein